MSEVTRQLNLIVSRKAGYSITNRHIRYLLVYRIAYETRFAWSVGALTFQVDCYRWGDCGPIQNAYYCLLLRGLQNQSKRRVEPLELLSWAPGKPSSIVSSTTFLFFVSVAGAYDEIAVLSLVHLKHHRRPHKKGGRGHLDCCTVVAH